MVLLNIPRIVVEYGGPDKSEAGLCVSAAPTPPARCVFCVLEISNSRNDKKVPVRLSD